MSSSSRSFPQGSPPDLSVEPPKLRISAVSAVSFTANVLQSYGVAEGNAQTISKALVAADLRGVESHGINRLPSYIARINSKALDPKAVPTIQQVTPAAALVDAKNGFGFVAAARGIDAAVDMAQTYGIGMVSVKNSNHFGMSAWIVERAVERDMMAMVFTNSSPALPAWGGKEPLVGVSPIACGAPGSGEGSEPFLLDMAPSVVARGKIYKALRRDESIPEGWALDKEGRSTQDPSAAVDSGAMLPIGGPKGSGLAIMMDVFSGVLSGSNFAGHVANPHDPSRQAGVGHLFLTMKPNLFMSMEEFKGRMGYLYDTVVNTPKAAGVDRIYFPGEIEQVTRRIRERDGIPMERVEADVLNREARAVGVADIRVL
ncbi:MAG: hypothetical protein M1831_002140 [Alyxoria varia]|nr:MAG: hypothetical protein M1831_002140 [Alyxoria varia]